MGLCSQSCCNAVTALVSFVFTTATLATNTMVTLVYDEKPSRLQEAQEERTMAREPEPV